MTAQDIVVILSSSLNVGLGILTLKNNRKDIVNQTFALFTGAIGIWSLSTILLSYSPNLFTGTLTISLGLIIGATFFLFVIVYPSSNVRASLRFYLPLIILIVLLFVGTVTRTILKDVKVENGVGSPVIGPLYIVLMLYVMILLPYSVFKMIRVYRASSNVDRLKMSYLLLALTGFISTVSFFNGILPVFGIVTFVNVGIAFSVFWTIMIFVAITRHRLFGVRLLFGNVLYYLVLSVVLLLLQYIFWLLDNALISKFESMAILIINIFAALIFVRYFSDIARYVRRILNRYIINPLYTPEELYESFVKEASMEIRLEGIERLLLHVLSKSIKPEKVGFVVWSNDRQEDEYRHFIGFEGNGDNFKTVSSVVANYWEQTGHSEALYLPELITVRDYNKRKNSPESIRVDKLIFIFQQFGIELIIPFARKLDPGGMLVLGSQSSGNPYTVEAISFLERLMVQASVSIGRALLYQQVEDFNKTLTRRIDQATKELHKKIEALEESRRRERDMLDILGHELRTPLSIIKTGSGFVDMLLEESVYKRIPEEKSEKIAKYMERIKENLEREIELVDTLLNTTRLDKGKLKLVRESVSMIDAIETGMRGQKELAQKKKLYIEFHRPLDVMNFPLVYADKVMIQEVVDNLLSNAVKYTEKGGIDISMEHDEKFVTVHIKDSGVGIPEDAQKHLGKKFYRVEQYGDLKDGELRLVRPGGTGLGLYVTFGIVQRHGGKVWFESKVGEGSTFHFAIPIHNGQRESNRGDLAREKDLFKRMGLNNGEG